MVLLGCLACLAVHVHLPRKNSLEYKCWSPGESIFPAGSQAGGFSDCTKSLYLSYWQVKQEQRQSLGMVISKGVSHPITVSYSYSWQLCSHDFMPEQSHGKWWGLNKRILGILTATTEQKEKSLVKPGIWQQAGKHEAYVLSQITQSSSTADWTVMKTFSNHN